MNTDLSLSTELTSVLNQIRQALHNRQAMLACAESCTGGWIAKLITDQPGSSSWFDRGFVTYSNAAKHQMLRVPMSLLAQYGAVSQQVAEGMAAGAIQHSSADFALAVTGIAGPDGGSREKPVGTVWLAWAGPSGIQSCVKHFTGNRDEIRQATVKASLEGLTARYLTPDDTTW
ncbi:MAG: CinA family protein [Pseudomonadota bacterium]